ncbi:MAG: AAA family ATPase, partial [Actinopolymorphaceae bacterium]
GVDTVVCVPYDRVSFDTAIAQGRTLAEVAPKSPARLPLRTLAADLMGITLPRQRRQKKKA